MRKFYYKFKALALAGRDAALILGLGSAFAVNPAALAANPENNQIAPTGKPDKSSAELPMPTARPVDQAHVKAGVGYHFANLWFAVENRNWPSAQYYLGEARSRLAKFRSASPFNTAKT